MAFAFLLLTNARAAYPSGTDEQCASQTCASPWYTSADWYKWVACCCRTDGNVFKDCDKKQQWYTTNGTNRCYVTLQRNVFSTGCTPSSECGSQPAGDCGLTGGGA